MCALLVGLPDVRVVGVGEWPQWLRIVITTDVERPSCCERPAHRHGVREVALVDLPVFGRPARLVWRTQRMALPDVSEVVDDAGSADRLGALRVDDPGWAVGDAAGRPARPLGVGGRARLELGLAHGDGRGGAVGPAAR
jgi:hypothetical protein